MSPGSALRATLVGGAVVAALAAPVAPASAHAPASIPVSHRLGLPTEPQTFAPKQAPASGVNASASSDGAPLSGGGRTSVLWIMGGVVGWAGVVVLRGVRRPTPA